MLSLPARRLLGSDLGPERYTAADDAPVLSREPMRLEVCTSLVGLARVCGERAAVLAVLVVREVVALRRVRSRDGVVLQGEEVSRRT